MKIIKRILYIISLLTVYELSKYVTNEILIKLTANDAVDKVPIDYEISKWR
ncbi:transcriptional activator RinB [Staphylococcus arlettae]|uniref:transcriptional activator RinB n=1 Tax=Staphylococcus TaxID=1279 RepID=UPI003C79FD56